MRELPLASRVPSKTRDTDADKLFGASLTWGKAFTFFSLVTTGKVPPVEKVRDDNQRLVILKSAARYCLSDEQVGEIEKADAESRNAYLIAFAKNTQQVVRYQLYGMVNNYVSEKILTPRDVHASSEVKLHLGLTGVNAEKSFMEL